MTGLQENINQFVFAGFDFSNNYPGNPNAPCPFTHFPQPLVGKEVSTGTGSNTEHLLLSNVTDDKSIWKGTIFSTGETATYSYANQWNGISAAGLICEVKLFADDNHFVFSNGAGDIKVVTGIPSFPIIRVWDTTTRKLRTTLRFQDSKASSIVQYAFPNQQFFPGTQMLGIGTQSNTPFATGFWDISKLHSIEVQMTPAVERVISY